MEISGPHTMSQTVTGYGTIAGRLCTALPTVVISHPVSSITMNSLRKEVLTWSRLTANSSYQFILLRYKLWRQGGADASVQIGLWKAPSASHIPWIHQILIKLFLNPFIPGFKMRHFAVSSISEEFVSSSSRLKVLACMHVIILVVSF